MAITINGSGTVTGLSVGGLPDGTVDSGTLATDSVTAVKIPDTVESSLKSGRKNLIINGGMDVWQRATSTTTAGVGYRTADRFWTLISGGTGTFQRSTDVPAGEGFNYSMSCDATGVQYLGTSVELSATGKPGIFKANTDYTLSVWTKGTAGSMSLYFRNAIVTGTDSTTVSFLALVTSAGWTKQSVTFNMGSIVQHANNTHLGIDISNITNGGKITGYQLEEGSVATDFEHRSYGEELAKCQRYARKIGKGIQGGFNGASLVRISVELNPPMRVGPTASLIADTTMMHVGSTTASSTSTSRTLGEYSATANGFTGYMSGFTGIVNYKAIQTNDDTILLESEI